VLSSFRHFVIDIGKTIQPGLFMNVGQQPAMLMNNPG